MTVNDLLSEMTDIPDMNQTIVVCVKGQGEYGGKFPVPDLQDAYRAVRYYLEQEWVAEISITINCYRGNF